MLIDFFPTGMMQANTNTTRKGSNDDAGETQVCRMHFSFFYFSFSELFVQVIVQPNC